ncbi:hypothetical protein Golob_024443 [Gossypium lobatum]|uniref:DUF4283 domain-containing protein n=1 Tax=Gossypium lobatum TaxID=34289 RepID=A0A7J8NEP0_9ROSI|nr:hypothetical protein [Gossypium lobatum]
MVSVLSKGDGDEVHSIEDRITKKVWFKDKHVVSNVAVAMDLTFEPTLSWKERLIGKGNSDLKKMIETIGLEGDDDFDFYEGDLRMDIGNGYFLAKFQNKGEFKKVLSKEPWVIYGQYLMMQPWTIDFNLA